MTNAQVPQKYVIQRIPIKDKTYECVIESGDENELAIRRELGERNSGHRIINQRLQASPIFGVPDLARAVVTPRNNERAVAVEVHGRHRHGVSPDHVKALASLDLPDAYRLVERSGDDEAGLGVEVDAEDEVGVAPEGLEAVEGGSGGPDAEGAVVGGGADVVGVGGPGEVGDALGVADEAVEEGEGGGGPDD